MALFDALNAQTPQAAQLRAGLLGMGAGLLQGSTGNYGQFGPALGMGFAGFGQGMQNQQLMQQRQHMLDAKTQQEQQDQQQRQQAQQWWARNGGNLTPQAMQAGIGTGNPYLAEMIKQASSVMPKPEEPTTLMRNIGAAGLAPGTPEYQQAILSGIKQGTTVNVGQSEFGTIPQGYELFTDPKTGARSMRPIAGGPAWQEQQDAEDQARNRQENIARAGGTVVQDIGRALSILEKDNPLAAGAGAIVGQLLPESDARTLQGYYQSILGNVGFDQLQAMREASPTGGALGAVNESELGFLQGILGRLDLTGRPEVQADNLKRINNIYMDRIHGTPEQIMQAYQQGQINPKTGRPLTLEDIEPLLFRFDLSFDDMGRPINKQGVRARQGGPQKISSASEYQSLPSGAQYIDPTGQIRTKR